jgi:DNA-binding response OmpR family regulator
MSRIVLVEDEPLISTMVDLNLRRNGFEVVRFAAAEPMLEFLRSNTCDLLLLDIMLPGMSGDAALRELRKMGVAVPVLMLTARHEADSKVAALDAGADDYVTKPFDMNELLARVRAAIRRTGGKP